jgi:prepilin-type N-terminal cleavage/methylation domain-containing protein
MTAVRRPAQRAGFTLIEVLAAVFLTSVVIGVAVSFYINLSDHSTRAAARTRETLHAAALLDRVATDLKNATMLVKAEDEDPLSHPWYFTAEQYDGSIGADRVKFITRANQPRVTAYHSADLVQVGYFLERSEEGGFVLYRWLAPGLPESLDLAYPTSDDERSMILGEGIADFGIRFLQEDGEWTEQWDSSQLLHSGQLPWAVEISVTMLGPQGAEEDDFVDLEDLRTYKRTAALPGRPLDLVAMVQERDLAESEPGGLGAGGSFDPSQIPIPGPEDCQNQQALIQQCTTVGGTPQQCGQMIGAFCASGGVVPEDLIPQ